jgi:hypothetical protein
MAGVPYTFATASTTIPLSQLDTNFQTPITIGATNMNLGQVVTTISGLTLANATISSVFNPLTIAQGGTNVSSITANAVIIGNGTSSIQTVSPGTAGNVLTSNGTNWISQTGGAVTNIANGTSNVAILSTNGNVTSYVNGVLQSTLSSNGLSLTGSLNSTNTFGFKNRIINGAMVIDQRNAGASTTPATDTYVIDRFLLRQPTAIYSAQTQTTTTTVGFSNSLKLTVSSVQGSISSGTVNNLTQYIEGYNTADLGWGTANAKTVTLSFWVQSSITGTYSVALYNNAFAAAYIATYTISVANTWQQVFITIAGPTTGTWLTTNGIGIGVAFDLGSGSTYNGTAGSWGSGALRTSSSVSLSTNASATFFITGVQLEVGSYATGFDYRPYTTELQLCQRYYWQWAPSQYARLCVVYADTSTSVQISVSLPVTLRTQTPSGIMTNMSFNGTALTLTGTNCTNNIAWCTASGTGLTTGAGQLYATAASGNIFSLSSEL